MQIVQLLASDYSDSGIPIQKIKYHRVTVNNGAEGIH
jgi:hypothetical protein